jgi:hypothetical protein
MSEPIENTVGVADVSAYLEAVGWRRRQQQWRGAAIWAYTDGAEVLVPSRDDMGDADLRLREILATLSRVEARPVNEVAEDIGSPLVDTQSYRTFPVGLPPGATTLPAGLQALTGIRDLFSAAARTVEEGPHLAFTGQRSRRVSEFLDRVQLATARAGSYVLGVRVPLGVPGEPGTPSGREVLLQVYDAVTATLPAAESGEPAAFDSIVTAGVSAEFCDALSDLAGPQRRQPFEIGFRWARGLRSELPPATVTLPAGSGVLLRTAAARLRALHVSGDAMVSGTVETLSEPLGAGTWRIKVRGELRTETSVAGRRTVWVRLPDRDAYDLAIAAHSRQRLIRAAGVLTSTNGRVELVARHGGLEELE